MRHKTDTNKYPLENIFEHVTEIYFRSETNGIQDSLVVYTDGPIRIENGIIKWIDAEDGNEYTVGLDEVKWINFQD